ncbi:MAG: FtsX-like permease family protein [Pseudohongiellaceae bacterium]
MRITPDANPDAVIAELDTLLAPYGGLGAYAREDQPSHLILQSELDQNRIIGSVIPAIFLAVAVFLLNLVLGRMITTQRGEIAVLKAFGYNNREIGLHYLMFAVAAVMLGTVIGTVGGLFLGDGYITLYSQYFELPDLEYRLSPTLLLISIVISLVGAVTGAMAAVRRAIALPPAEAMRPEAPARFRPGFLEKIGFAALLSSAGRMILRNLERKPLQAVFSSIGVAMSVAILVIGLFMFDSINYLVELQFRNIQREDIALTFREIVPRSVGYELQHLPGVTRVETYRTVPARLRAAHREQETGITGMQPDGRLRRLVNSSAREVPVPPDGIILGKFLADRLRLENGDAVTIEILEGRRQTAEVEVVGIIEEFLGISAYMSLSGLQRLTGDSEVVSGAYLAVDQSGIDQLYQNIKQIPAVAGVSSPASMLESFEQQLSEGILLSAGFLLAFAGVIAVGVIYNGARIALSERGRELASLRVMGFHRREVAMLLLGEQALITLFAIPIGWLIGYGLAFSISTGLETDTFRIPFIADPGTFILSAGIVMAAAVASGLAVRRRLDRIDLVEVLKTRE